MLKARRFLAVMGFAVGTVVGVFLLLAVCVYLPPVQRFLVGKITAWLSEETGWKVSADGVRLAFPLDLAVTNVRVTEEGDTLASLDGLKLCIPIKPLLRLEVDVSGFELWRASLNTRNHLSDIEIKGKVGMLALERPSVVNLKRNEVDVRRVCLKDSDVKIWLNDTAAQDTSKSEPSRWRIRVGDADMCHTAFYLQMPHDSMRISVQVDLLNLKGIDINLEEESYKAKRVRMEAPKVTYDLPYEAFARGFDTNHMDARNIHLDMNDLSYQGGNLQVSLGRLAFQEKSGLELKQVAGHIKLDSAGIDVKGLRLLTPYSKLEGRAQVDWNSLKPAMGGKIDVEIAAQIGAEDLKPFAVDMTSEWGRVMAADGVTIDVKAVGNMDEMRVGRCRIDMPGCMSLTMAGEIRHLMDDKLRAGNFDCRLQTVNMGRMGRWLSDLTGGAVAVPDHLVMDGNVNCKGDAYGMDILMRMGKGSMKIKGKYAVSAETYQADVNALRFPLGAFLPADSLAPLTARAVVQGKGFDFLKKKTSLTAKADIEKFAWNGLPLDSISLYGKLAGGHGFVNLKADNRMTKMLTHLVADLSPQNIDMSLRSRVGRLDMRYLTADTLVVSTSMGIKGSLSPKYLTFKTSGRLDTLAAYTPSKRIKMHDIDFYCHSLKEGTNLRVESGDLNLMFASDSTLTAFASGMGHMVSEMGKQIDNAYLHQDSLMALLPSMELDAKAGRENPAYLLLKEMGYDFHDFHAHFVSDNQNGLNGNALLTEFRTGNLLLDKAMVDTKYTSQGIFLNGKVENTSKRNPNKFKAMVEGKIMGNEVSAMTTYIDEKGVKGLDMGVKASFDRDEMTFNLFPLETIIAYRKFNINKGNFFTLGKDRHISANVDLLADDRTGLKVMTPEGDSTRDVTISVSNLNLKELTTTLPYFPRLGGMFSGDLHAQWQDTILSAVGQVDLQDFSYEECKFGDMEADLSYMPESMEKHYVSANVSSQGQEVLSVFGNYIMEGEGLLDMVVNLTDMPAHLLNGFMSADGTIGLTGNLNGEMNVKGPASAFLVDGSLNPDSLHIISSLYGVDLKVADKPINAVESKLWLNALSMYSVGEKPLTVDGNVDFSDLSDIRVDLTCKANDFLVINSPKTKQSVVFGQVYADIDATLKGNTDFMMLKGDLSVSGKSDMTYVMKDSPLTVENQLEGLVEFVDFSDSVQVKEEPLKRGGMYMQMNINMNETAKMRVNLSEDGSGYFDCRGGGKLSMKYYPSGEINLTGKFVMRSGEMKYTLPFIPLKTFTLQGDNNYISFTGNPINPTLNITAMEQTRASYSEENASTRMVKFNVGVAITQTLNNMGLQFLIEAPEDMALQNEISSMSREEQNKTAVGMMVTGMYLSSTNKSSFKANNALNTFLQSKIQDVAGDALKTLDLTVGVEGSTTASGNAQTDYSFQFAKHFWNDRVTFRIGGKVSAGSATTENQSFIDNISLEYRLGNGTSRNLRLFYEHDKIDPLEGNYVVAGAGLVLRKKTDTFGELFIFKRPKSESK